MNGVQAQPCVVSAPHAVTSAEQEAALTIWTTNGTELAPQKAAMISAFFISALEYSEAFSQITICQGLKKRIKEKKQIQTFPQTK